MSFNKITKGEKIAQLLSRIVARLRESDHIVKYRLAEEQKADGHWRLTQSARSTIQIKHLQGNAKLPHMRFNLPLKWQVKLVVGLKQALPM